MKTNTEDKQKGFVLVMVAIVLIILIGFVALGVDTGALYSARTAAQSVADSAALAGAFTFVNNPSAPQPATANAHALKVALTNNVMGKAVTASDVTVTTNVAKRQVTVAITSTQRTYFAAALGNLSADIAVTGTAEASEDSKGGCWRKLPSRSDCRIRLSTRSRSAGSSPQVSSRYFSRSAGSTRSIASM